MKPKIWTIPVAWEVCSTVEVEAFTLAEMPIVMLKKIQMIFPFLPMPTMLTTLFTQVWTTSKKSDTSTTMGSRIPMCN